MKRNTLHREERKSNALENQKEQSRFHFNSVAAYYLPRIVIKPAKFALKYCNSRVHCGACVIMSRALRAFRVGKEMWYLLPIYIFFSGKTKNLLTECYSCVNECIYCRGKGYALTCGKFKRRRHIMRKEKKEEYRERQRQARLKRIEDKKLLAQGLVTEEDLKRMAEERKMELKRKTEEAQAAMNLHSPVDEANGGTLRNLICNKCKINERD